MDAQSAVDVQERRDLPRERVQNKAIITYGDRLVGCTVRDISGSGVAVFLPEGRDIPDEVDFTLFGERTVRPATVVRRLAPLVALRFKQATG